MRILSHVHREMDSPCVGTCVAAFLLSGCSHLWHHRTHPHAHLTVAISPACRGLCPHTCCFLCLVLSLQIFACVYFLGHGPAHTHSTLNKLFLTTPSKIVPPRVLSPAASLVCFSFFIEPIMHSLFVYHLSSPRECGHHNSGGTCLSCSLLHF